MKFENNLVGVLMMVKNEEESIIISLNSIKNFFKNIIVFDTGSTDNTVANIKEFCETNNINLFLKEGTFKSFPESRNEAIEFAETVKVKFLLMMDAGDEFQTNKSKKEFMKIISHIPSNINYGLVKQKWFENIKGSIETNDHNDLRFIRNKSNCRYDLDIPVHEAFLNVGNYINMSDIFILYQDRIKYGVSTNNRYKKDIELLSKAKQTKRNLYFLAQSYMSIDDFENGFKYNVLSLETNDKSFAAIDEKFTYVRAGYCAMMAHKPIDVIFKYLEFAANLQDPPIDAFIYIFKVSIDNRCVEKSLPYIKTAFRLKKPTNESTLVNHNFYDYVRWNLISIVCLLSNQNLDLGKEACLRAIRARNHPDDLNNINLFK